MAKVVNHNFGRLRGCVMDFCLIEFGTDGVRRGTATSRFVLVQELLDRYWPILSPTVENAGFG